MAKKNTTQLLANSEPSWEENKFPDDMDYINALNWYSANADVKDAQKWFKEWVKNQKFKKTEERTILEYNIEDYGPLGRTLGFVCRMMNNGLVTIPDSTQIKLNDLIKTAKIKKPKKKVVKKEEPVVKKPSIQDRIEETVRNLAGEIDVIFDEYILSVANKKKYEFNMHRWLVAKNAKPLICRKLAVEIEKDIFPDWKELTSDDCDKDLKEAYKFLNKTQIKRVYEFVLKLLDDCEKSAILATKIKEVKPKSIDKNKQVSKVKYKKEDTENNLKSIQPIKILGSKNLWVYNTKTRKLGYYISDEPEGLQVKGTTITNYNHDKSYQKILRKPEDCLDIVLKSGIMVIIEMMNNIKARSSSLNGRLNDDTILLRVI